MSQRGRTKNDDENKRRDCHNVTVTMLMIFPAGSRCKARGELLGPDAKFSSSHLEVTGKCFPVGLHAHYARELRITVL